MLHRYVDEILRPHVVQLHQQFGEEFILMQDNARPHVANVVMAFLADNFIQTLDWPPLSPDLNPIEHLWDLLKRRLRLQAFQPQNLNELYQRIEGIWNNIPNGCIVNLIESMPRRCADVIRARGGKTRY